MWFNKLIWFDRINKEHTQEHKEEKTQKHKEKCRETLHVSLCVCELELKL